MTDICAAIPKLGNITPAQLSVTTGRSLDAAADFSCRLNLHSGITVERDRPDATPAATGGLLDAPPTGDPRDRIGAEHSYKGPDFHGDDTPRRLQ